VISVRCCTNPSTSPGLTVDLLGFVFSVIALQLLPLFLVQAIVAASVGVTAVIVALSGRPLGRPAWVALCASLGGLVLLAVSSEPHDGGTFGHRLAVVAAGDVRAAGRSRRHRAAADGHLVGRAAGLGGCGVVHHEHRAAGRDRHPVPRRPLRSGYAAVATAVS